MQPLTSTPSPLAGLEPAVVPDATHPPVREVRGVREVGRPTGRFLAEDTRMRELAFVARKVARTNSPVLIQGESGVGKEVLARYLHDESNRAGRPWVKVNCSAMPHELLESELFGHERGSFTGAHLGKEGKFEVADGGTLLLDEIGEMCPLLQAKLLHLLEDGTFTRVGGNQAVRCDARLITTTIRPLDRTSGEQEFRKDLFFRLKVIHLRIPPLRERRADIPVLCEHFLRAGAEGRDQVVGRLPERILEAFLEYSWPGNVRELEHLIRRYLILPDVDLILAELEGEKGLEPNERALAVHIDASRLGPGKISLKPIAARAAEEAEKAVILRILDETHWNRRQAADRLDICYKTLLNKLHLWGHGGPSAAGSRGTASQRDESNGGAGEAEPSTGASSPEI